VADGIEQARESCRARAWADACAAFSAAEQAGALAADDLERFATACYMIGRDEDYLALLERAHHAHLGVGGTLPAARCAFWLGFQLFMRGPAGRATGWLARAQRLLEREARDCAERGYLLLPSVEQQLAGGGEAARAAVRNASEIARIGERFADPDLVACARHLEGRALLGLGQVAEGLVLLDEVMVAVTGGELSPLMTGLLYCSVIGACQDAFALDRAGEWSAAMARWCRDQPQMRAFRGICLVHRAEIMQLRGAWREAFDEVHAALERSRGTAPEEQPPGSALYQQGEVHRLLGELAEAEEMYRRASQCGCDPQPGLALLRLAQGKTEAAAAAIRRVVGSAGDRRRRTRLLPAFVEILVAAGALDDARAAYRELEEAAVDRGSEMLLAMAAQARGAVDLAAGDALAAVASLRRASDLWQRLGVPYQAARARELAGVACAELGDADGSQLEQEAARAAYHQLGAAPDLARLDARARPGRASRAHGLTQRELEVLRLLAAGHTNKAIARQLGLSERTVDRHVSNIFTKFDVSSRAAATAFAYEHELL
jgi:DNA-binding CsgD family transcriptional regulator